MRPTKNPIISLTCLTLGISLLACISLGDSPESIETRHGGNSSAGYFLATPSSAAPVPIHLAVGARYAVTIWDWEDLDQHAPAALQDVEAAHPSVMRIVETRGDTVIVEGLAPGSSFIKFSGVADGERMRDTLEVKVTAPEQVQFYDPCGLDRPLIAGVEGYLTRGYSTSSSGLPGQGYGLGALTVEDGSGAQLINELETEHVSVIAVDAQTDGPLILHDIISDTQHSVAIIAPARVEKVELVKTFEGNTQQKHPGRLTLLPRVTLEDGAVTCPRVLYTVRSKTPDICQIDAIGEALANEQTSTPERLRIITKNAGLCILAVAIAAGQALTSDEFEDEFTVNEPLPRAMPPRTVSGGGYDDGD